ncbi:MAG: SCP2 sterol-binding domain-containing protein [Acidobacteriota bacterium]|jgi:putative sterol carrier protein
MADLTVDQLTGMIREKLATVSGFNASARLVFDEGGSIFISGKTTPGVVSNEELPADVTLRLSLATLNKLYRRETNATTAVMSGKIKIEGNLMAAMQLDKILS